MDIGTIIIIIVVGVLLILVFYAIGVYNNLINARNKAKDQFSQIDVQLKRRSDMIPNLVETVKGYAKLFALSEAYPELKANENFMSLQADLKETEDKISYARGFYNDTVLTYNNLREQFPSSIIASMFKFEKLEFFNADEKDRENPQVKF